MAVRELIRVMPQALNDWSEHKAHRLGAALAYYSIFSIGPMMVIVLAVAGQLFGDDVATKHVFAKMQELVGRDGAEAIQALVLNARHPDKALLATLLSSLFLVFGAAGVFYQLKDSLNTIWEVQPKPWISWYCTIRTNIFDYFLSLSMVLGLAFLLTISLVVDTVLTVFSQIMGRFLPGGEAVWHVANGMVTLACLVVLFAAIFKYLPEVRIPWGDVWLGATVTALLFILGKFLIGWYIGNSSLGSSYGAASSLVAILIWVYYSSQIFLFGAEITQVYSRREGSGGQLKETAMPVTEKAKAMEGAPSNQAVEKEAARESREERKAS